MAGDANENLWKTNLKAKFPQHFNSVKVLDIGSADINGNNTTWFDNSIYLGLDILPYKNVHVVSVAHEYDAPDGSFDVVCSTSELEHDKHWDKTLKKMVALTKSGGFIWFACAHSNLEHGTPSTSPNDSLTSGNFGEVKDRDWKEYYKNLDVEDVRKVLDLDEIFSEYEIGYSQGNEELSLYFWGVKK